MASTERQIPPQASFDPPRVELESPASRRREDGVEISVVIPAFNEEARVEPYLRPIAEYFTQRNVSHEILVVDDGSADKTAAIVRDCMQKIPTLGLLSYRPNRGKGYAVRAGMRAACGRLRMFADADGSTPISEVEKLQAKVSAGCDIAIGSRVLKEPQTEIVIRPHRKVIAQAFRAVRQILLPLDIADSQCGFKLFTENAATALFGASKLDGLAFDVEVLYLAARQGFKVSEVPVTWHDSYPSRISFWKDPFRMFADLLRIRRLHR